MKPLYNILNQNHIFRRVLLCLFSSYFIIQADPQTSAQSNNSDDQTVNVTDTPSDNTRTENHNENDVRRIGNFYVVGNKYVTAEAILSLVPFKVGEIYNPAKSSALIKNIYYGLNRFKDIKIYTKDVGNDVIDIYIKVDEKKLLKEVVFNGNSNLSNKEINEKIPFKELPAIEKEELKKYAQEIKKLYLDKGYHLAQITADLVPDGDQVNAVFTIVENNKASVKRIFFKKNHHISSKELKNILYTREDWILGFLDRAGSYHPDRLEADKHIIEQYYQNNGYLTAKVVDVDIAMDQHSNVTLTFEITEGDLYTINEVKAPTPEDQKIPEEYVLSQLPARKGNNYSREAIVESIKKIELIWQNQGYIFAHVEPSIAPDEDTKTVNLAFYTELGNRVFLNKLTIKGNKKTKDKIIRRRIILEEGELLSQFALDFSKNRVEGLGFFDPRDGVNFKVIRLDDHLADVDLLVKEAKTGHFHMKMGFGGAGTDLKNPASGLSVGVELADTNLAGSGVSLNAEANWSKEETNFMFHVAQPWLFDKPISGAADIYHRRPTFDNFRNALPIHEKITGGALSVGFITRPNRLLSDTQMLFTAGLDNIAYENKNQGTAAERELARERGVPVPLRSLLPFGSPESIQFQEILNNEFSQGTYGWLAMNLEQDLRNHPMHPSRGHKWKAVTKFAFPAIQTKNGFFKFDLDAAWFTPIIGERDLVLKLHGHLGFVGPFKNKAVPYDELYNIGGPASVRGFLFGQIGPKFLGDSIGAKKALFANVELIFPITPDFNMKGVLFYDGGAGWDNPNTSKISPQYLTDNNFDYRHSVGIGVRLLNPMPMRIDWGFKLDPRKNRFNPARSESTSEVHFGMSYDW